MKAVITMDMIAIIATSGITCHTPEDRNSQQNLKILAFP
jgi:hypothetical protein